MLRVILLVLVWAVSLASWLNRVWLRQTVLSRLDSCGENLWHRVLRLLLAPESPMAKNGENVCLTSLLVCLYVRKMPLVAVGLGLDVMVVSRVSRLVTFVLKVVWQRLGATVVKLGSRQGRTDCLVSGPAVGSATF